MLLRICEGEKVVYDEAGTKTHVKLGDFVFLRRGERLTVENYVSDQGCYCADGFVIAETMMLELAQERPKTNSIIGTRGGPMHEEFNRAFSNLIRTQANGAMPECIISHQFKELALWMEEAGVFVHTSTRPKLTARLRDLLESDLEKSWKSGDAARTLGMSESTLRRALRKENTSFSRELRDAKLSHALMLIQTTDRSLADIAFASGFSSQSRLSETFKARFSVSPRVLMCRSRQNARIA